MTTTKSPLEQAIKTALYWNLAPGLGSGETHYYASGNGGVLYSASEFAMIDPRLPAWLAQQLPSLSTIVLGSTLQCAVSYWTKPRLTIKNDIFESYRDQPVPIESVYQIECEPTIAGPYVALMCVAYVVKTNTALGDHAVDTEVVKMTVTYDYMDLHFPGWQERQSVGLALGMERAELAQYALSLERLNAHAMLSTEVLAGVGFHGE